VRTPLVCAPALVEGVDPVVTVVEPEGCWVADGRLDE
jgi:hypothetical protein